MFFHACHAQVLLVMHDISSTAATVYGLVSVAVVRWVLVALYLQHTGKARTLVFWGVTRGARGAIPRAPNPCGGRQMIARGVEKSQR